MKKDEFTPVREMTSELRRSLNADLSKASNSDEAADRAMAVMQGVLYSEMFSMFKRVCNSNELSPQQQASVILTFSVNMATLMAYHIGDKEDVGGFLDRMRYIAADFFKASAHAATNYVASDGKYDEASAHAIKMMLGLMR